MKEHPILFSAPMIKAILEGRKTVTRRIITRRNSDCTGYKRKDYIPSHFDWDNATADGDPKHGYLHVPISWDGTRHRVFSKLDLNDQLWVRESFSPLLGPFGESIIYAYKATDHPGCGPYKPSIHMPREASRIQLLITSVRPERLHDITEEDAILEGIYQRKEPAYNGLFPWCASDNKKTWSLQSPRTAFACLWELINGVESWVGNPWVWRIEYQKIKP